MRAVVSHAESPRRLLGVLKNVAGWQDWLGGVVATETDGNVHVVVAGPPPTSAELALAWRDDGVDMTMVEGRLTACEVSIQIGTQSIVAIVDVAPLYPLPTILLRELEARVLPDALVALIRAAQRKSDPAER